MQATTNVVHKIEIIYKLLIDLQSKNSQDGANLLIGLLDSVFQFLYRGAQQTALVNRPNLS
jgi:hypothetical protein